MRREGKRMEEEEGKKRGRWEGEEIKGEEDGGERKTSRRWEEYKVMRGEEMRRGAEEGDVVGERTGGERTGSAWDSSDFLWAIRRIKWVADKGKSVSFYKHWHWISKFGRLWTGHRYGCVWRRSGSWVRLVWLTGCSPSVDSSPLDDYFRRRSPPFRYLHDTVFEIPISTGNTNVWVFNLRTENSELPWRWPGR